MDSNKVDMYLAVNSKYFPSEKIPWLKDRLLSLPDEKYSVIQCVEMKDPVISIILSIFLGSFGVDRFYIGDVGLGLGKLLTCAGAWIWWLIDLFCIMGATKRKNLEKLLPICL